MIKTISATFHGEDYTKLARNLSFRVEENAVPARVKLDRNVFEEVLDSMRVEYPKPDDVMPAKPDSLSLDCIVPDAVFTVNQSVFTYPIFSLPHCQLKHPIQIVIEAKEDGNVIVWSDEFELSGLGGTKEEALADFSSFVFSDRNSLRKIPTDKLSDGAKDLLRRYEEYLE